ncbi:sulfatase [Myxococcota bacterium]|nr:sulfatase [Myxococcota bacterium]
MRAASDTRAFRVVLGAALLLAASLGARCGPEPLLENAHSAAHAGCPVRPGLEPRPRAPGGAPILLILVDTLRLDRLGVGGSPRPLTPRLDELTLDSRVFLQARSAAPWTLPAVAGVMTGHHPAALGIGFEARRLPDRVPTLAERLRERGYATAGLVSHLFLGEKWGFDRGFERWDQSLARGHTFVSSEELTDKAIACLDALSRETDSWFLFVHYFDPHFDFIEHEGFRFSDGTAPRIRSENDNMMELQSLAAKGQLDEGDFEALRDAYDSEVAWTDHHVGRLLDALRERGGYDDALIVFTADHGEMLGERNNRWIGHTLFVYDELVRVPLLLKMPGSKHRGLVGAPVSTVALFRSLLEGSDGAADAGGLLSESPRGGTTFSQTLRYRRVESVTDGIWKLIDDPDRNTVSLYELRSDPGERENVSERHPGQRARLLGELERWRAAIEIERSRIERAAAPELTPEEREQLRALGYLE